MGRCRPGPLDNSLQLRPIYTDFEQVQNNTRECGILQPGDRICQLTADYALPVGRSAAMEKSPKNCASATVRSANFEGLGGLLDTKETTTQVHIVIRTKLGEPRRGGAGAPSIIPHSVSSAAITKVRGCWKSERSTSSEPGHSTSAPDSTTTQQNRCGAGASGRLLNGRKTRTSLFSLGKF